MESIWPSFRLDPREAQHAALRASDADRAVVSSVLGDAYADGRLSAEEYDERESANLAAKTLGELPPLLADLVGPVGQVASRPEAQSPRELHRAAVRAQMRSIWETAAASSTPFFICLVVWLFTSPGGYFWPMWALIPVLLATGPLVIGSPASIRADERRRQRKQDEALGQVEQPPKELG